MTPSIQTSEQRGAPDQYDKAAGDFILLKITARVIHKDGDDLRENMDLAHFWVVKSFVSLTDEHVRHERWRQES